MAQVINFQVTPYSDEDAAYVNNLSDEQIYHLFASNTSPDILTAGLYAIYKLESQAQQILVNHSDINDSWLLKESQRICPNSYLSVDPDILKSLKDVYMRDDFLLSDNINALGVYPNVFMMIIGGMYAGHIYAWTIDSVTNIIGIRSSFLQILSSKCNLKQTKITAIFLDAIQKWAVGNSNKSTHYLRFLQPLGRLPDLLTKCGFVMAKIIRNQEELGWLFDNGSLGDIPLAERLAFRERDYIVQVADSMQCISHAYLYQQI